jgi:hypothetical protein
MRGIDSEEVGGSRIGNCSDCGGYLICGELSLSFSFLPGLGTKFYTMV